MPHICSTSLAGDWFVPTGGGLEAYMRLCRPPRTRRRAAWLNRQTLLERLSTYRRPCALFVGPLVAAALVLGGCSAGDVNAEATSRSAEVEPTTTKRGFDDHYRTSRPRLAVDQVLGDPALYARSRNTGKHWHSHSTPLPVRGHGDGASSRGGSEPHGECPPEARGARRGPDNQFAKDDRRGSSVAELCQV